MNKLIIITALAVIGLTEASLALEMPKFKVGQDYGAIRKRMLKLGWHPYHHKEAQTCSDIDTRCIERPEMIACAGTGDANCKFLWRKGRKMIAICTVDDPAKFDGMCDPY